MPVDATNDVLLELFSVANAAMTRSERVQRAAPVLANAGMTVADAVNAMSKPDLAWNGQRARVLGVDTSVWMQALDVAGLAAVVSLDGLLDVMHKAEAGAAMLRAGYKPERDASGKVNWTR